MIPQIEPKIGEDEREAVDEYMRSDGWLTEYEQTRAFENDVAEVLGADHAWATANGTLALFVALDALGIGPGDEVLVPDLTMIATANVVEYLGAEPVLADVDPETMCLDLKAAATAATEQTAAMIYVSLNGRSHSPDRIRRIASDHDLYLVEDAAQSLGSRTDGEYLGSVGDIGCFSFSYAKIVTTGQGGMVVTNDEEMNERVRRVRNFGRDEGGVDRHETLGLNAKFTDLQAVVGRTQLAELDRRIERKRDLFRQYRERLGGLTTVEFPTTDLSETPPWFVDILLPDGSTRRGLANRLEDAGIDTRPFYPAVHTQSPYVDREYQQSFETSLDLSRRGLWLPSSITLDESDIDDICREIRNYLT
jgi:perosamine synthetase